MRTTTQHCVECGAVVALRAERCGFVIEVADLPRKRGQTCKGWAPGRTCRKTSLVTVTVMTPQEIV